jgi:phosphatidylglycerophosphatase A
LYFLICASRLSLAGRRVQLTTDNGQPTAVKESSDELNPTVINAGAAPPQPRHSRTLKDYSAIAIATVGVGYMPIAPGTWGSLVAVALYLALRLTVFGTFSNSNDTADSFFHSTFLALELLIIITTIALGVWAASHTERILRIKDPGKVVIDEVAGQLIALLAIPTVIDQLWWVWLALAFLLFRFFDIVKPYPARKLESLPGGLGIMADDLIAGVYSAIVVAVVIAVRWLA